MQLSREDGKTLLRLSQAACFTVRPEASQLYGIRAGLEHCQL